MNKRQLLECLGERGLTVSQTSLEACLQPQTSNFLTASFSSIGANEGTLWLLDGDQKRLVPIWNSGSSADRFVGRYSQTLDSGLISLVCVTEQGLCENSVYENDNQDRALDQYLGKVTCAMIAVPLRFHEKLRGVVSCVRIKDSRSLPDTPPFSASDLETMDDAVHSLQRQLDQLGRPSMEGID